MFGTVAAGYADARPGYPDRVYELLRDRCDLGPNRRVLDIGAGSGQATVRLLAAGAEVVAVEPNGALGNELRKRLGRLRGLRLVATTFEDADLSENSFDLVTSATSFHWLDPDAVLPKIGRVLRPGGWLAVWWNVFGDPNLADPFHDATETLLRDLEPSPAAGARGGVPFGLDVRARTSELTGHGFDDVAYEAIQWTLRLDAPQTRRLYQTYSNIARLPADRSVTILDAIERIADAEFGGQVQRRMVTPIYTAHR